jgi:hypothetical protein
VTVPAVLLPVVKLVPPIGWDRRDGVETIFVKGAGSGPSPRLIAGLASTARICADNFESWSLAPEGCQANLPVPVLVEHGGDEIGQVVFLRKSRTGIFVRAPINDDRAWRKIEGGEVKGLSVTAAGRRLRVEENGVKFYGTWTLKEVSVCARPGNSDCKFWVYNA